MAGSTFLALATESAAAISSGVWFCKFGPAAFTLDRRQLSCSFRFPHFLINSARAVPTKAGLSKYHMAPAVDPLAWLWLFWLKIPERVGWLPASKAAFKRAASSSAFLSCKDI